MEIRRCSPGIGAEVFGVDVRTLDDAGFAPLYQAWLDANVLVVHGQSLTIPEFLDYSRRFGRLEPPPPPHTRAPHPPEATGMDPKASPQQGVSTPTVRTRGMGWHTDLTFEKV